MDVMSLSVLGSKGGIVLPEPKEQSACQLHNQKKPRKTAYRSTENQRNRKAARLKKPILPLIFRAISLFFNGLYRVCLCKKAQLGRILDGY
jgi:hypothetical protein